MPKLDVALIMEREAKAQARKDEWRSIYEDCYEFALPQRNLYSGYYEGKVAGKGKMARCLIVQLSTLRSGLLIVSRRGCFLLTNNGAAWNLAQLYQRMTKKPLKNYLMSTTGVCLTRYARQTLTWRWVSFC